MSNLIVLMSLGFLLVIHWSGWLVLMDITAKAGGRGRSAHRNIMKFTLLLPFIPFIVVICLLLYAVIEDMCKMTMKEMHK